MRVSRRAATLALLSTLVVPAAEAGARSPEVVPGQYVVLYEDTVRDPSAETTARERRDGFRSRLRYGKAVKGFAAKLNARQVERLQADPEVATVTPDRVVRATGTLATGETAPTGVRRMQAASGTTVRDASTANVAVIDTGVDLDHPELNVASGKNCVTAGAPADDDHGHGTHVAGSIAARNDGSGVVGVAPGTRISAVKVLAADGSGTTSQVICGIDWVTPTRTDAEAANDIAVANMSLGGIGSPVATCSTTTDPQHKAICASTAAGVTYVVAAGNDGWDFDYAPSPDTPAAYPEVLTVTAVSDSDGLSGATGGSPTCRSGEYDDRYASFSNYAATSGGAAHIIAAPGVCIRSTAMGGGTTTMSGTSMASPHVAGAVALCLGEAGGTAPCAGLTPAQVIAKVRSDAKAYNDATTSFGFRGDPLRPVSGAAFGYLQFAGTAAATSSPPPVTSPTVVNAAPARTTIQTGSYAGGDVGNLSNDDDATYRVASTTKRTKATAWYGTFAETPSALSKLDVTYRGSNSVACTQTVEIYRFTDGTWVALDQRMVGSTEAEISKPVSGTLSSYVSGGNLHVRVRCQTTSSGFTASGDLLRIAYVR